MPKVRKKEQSEKRIKKAQSAQKNERLLSITHHSETDEYEIRKKATETNPEVSINFPKDIAERYQMMPNEFENVQAAIEALNHEQREVAVYSNSLESYLGYDSLLRIMGKFFGQKVAYYRSESGGSLSIEEARKEVYKRNITEKETVELFEHLMRLPTEFISFTHLLELNSSSPVIAQNLWEMIKRDAAHEFESGHRAAAAFEPADYMTDAWNRASYLGLRESLIEEWQPKGGIELTMIDSIAQSWLMLQHWTEESVRRATTRARQEDHQFYEWKQWQKERNKKQWDDGFWDIPYVYEQTAIEHAAQMADRWQRMYFRAIRSLRDWRRYAPNLTINNANQVNIASDGGQQINVAKSENEKKKLT